MSEMSAAAAAWRPNLIIGAPAGSLNPQIPSPVRAEPVALEIADGIGISLDGESLIVSDGVRDGVTTITGHTQDDGTKTYPQRDYKVVKNANHTQITSFYPNQTYDLDRDGKTLHVKNQDDRDTYDVNTTAKGLESSGKYEVNHFTVSQSGDDAHVQGFDQYHNADVHFAAGSVGVNGIPERTFTWTKTENGLHIQGPLKPQSFDVTFQKDGFTVQGYYPQQKYVVQHNA